MRILQIVHCYYPSVGGAQTLARVIAEKMAAKGHEIRILTSAMDPKGGYLSFKETRMPLRETLNGIEINRHYGATIWYECGRWTEKNFPKNRFKAWILWQFTKLVRQHFKHKISGMIHDFKPDIILLTAATYSHSSIFMDAYREKPFPYIVIPALHGTEARSSSREVGERLQKAAAVLVFTNYEAELVKKIHGVPHKNIFVAGLGSDLPDKSQEVTDRQPWILCFGRRMQHKGMDILFEAMKLVWKSRPDAKLVFAGSNPYHQPWVSSVDKEFQDRLLTYDNISDIEKGKLFDSACCLAFSSKSESFGLVLLEAWKCRLPVIAWDIPPMKEIISEAVDGFLIPLDNISVLAEKILFYLNHPDAAQSMGEAGYQKTAQKYQWNNFIHTLEKACHFCLSFNKNASSGKLDRKSQF